MGQRHTETGRRGTTETLQPAGLTYLVKFQANEQPYLEQKVEPQGSSHVHPPIYIDTHVSTHIWV